MSNLNVTVKFTLAEVNFVKELLEQAKEGSAAIISNPATEDALRQAAREEWGLADDALRRLS